MTIYSNHLNDQPEVPVFKGGVAFVFKYQTGTSEKEWAKLEIFPVPENPECKSNWSWRIFDPSWSTTNRNWWNIRPTALWNPRNQWNIRPVDATVEGLGIIDQAWRKTEHRRAKSDRRHNESVSLETLSEGRGDASTFKTFHWCNHLLLEQVPDWSLETRWKKLHVQLSLFLTCAMTQAVCQRM